MSVLWPCSYLLTCGCKVELSESLRWKLTERCEKHPVGTVPVKGMTRIPSAP